VELNVLAGWAAGDGDSEPTVKEQALATRASTTMLGINRRRMREPPISRVTAMNRYRW
jgi:hypothetical protein